MQHLSLFLIWFLIPAAEASIQKLCVPNEMTRSLPFFLSVNSDSLKGVEAISAALSSKRVMVEAENKGPQVQFVLATLQPRDCLLLNDEDASEMALQSPTSAGRHWLQPAVFFRDSDKAKHYGLVEKQSLAFLKAEPSHRELKLEQLLKHTDKLKELSILYVLCPKQRDDVCTLSIRHKGKWVKDKKTGKKLEYALLARATRPENAKAPLPRTLPGGDTPQGIYYLWATMFTDEAAFGREPRIDLDAGLPPLNAYPYELHSYVLSKLVPQEAWDDFWLNEWPLAYRLGRINLRVHGQTGTGFRPTAGCLNAGEKTAELLAKLEQLGLLATSSSRPQLQSDPSTLGWQVSPALGKAFLIVKDKD